MLSVRQQNPAFVVFLIANINSCVWFSVVIPALSLGDGSDSFARNLFCVFCDLVDCNHCDALSAE